MRSKREGAYLMVENLSNGKALQVDQGATLPGSWSMSGVRLRVTAAAGWLHGTVNEQRQLVVTGWAKPALQNLNFPPRSINLQKEASSWL